MSRLKWEQLPNLPVTRRATQQLLLQANSQLRANLLARVRHLVLQGRDSDFVSPLVKQPLVLLLVAQAKPRDLFLHSANLQEAPLRLAPGSPVPQTRGRRYSRGPGPFAFSRETLAVRRCNRAVRSGGHPICVRCRPRRKRGARAGCDSKCSRSPHKRAHRARTFLIAAADKCRCLPRRIADSDVRFANSEGPSIRLMRKRAYRRFQGREERDLSSVSS